VTGVLLTIGSRWFYYRLHQQRQTLGDRLFRAYESWQWCNPADEQ
jgi:hypothetical protein